VHAINLFADGTAERTVLANLLRRIDRMRMSEVEVAACVIGRSEPASKSTAAEKCATVIDLRNAALAEAHRLARTRHAHSVGMNVREDVVPVLALKSRRPSLTCLFRIRLVTRSGRLVEDTLLPLRVMTQNTPLLRRREVRRLGEALATLAGPELTRRASAIADRRARDIAVDAANAIARAMRRERAIAAWAAAGGARFVQAGLFDSRALKRKWHGQEQREALHQQSEAHAHLLDADARVVLAHEPQLAFLLILCSPV
jgi:hypothetical protein